MSILIDHPLDHPLIDKPGCYQLPLRAYVHDPVIEPSLSASICHTLTTQSALHAWIEHPRLNPNYHPREDSRFDVGTVAHQILLEGHRNNIVTVEAEDWRTKSAKETRDSARAQNKLPILRHQMADVEAMLKAAQTYLTLSEIGEGFAGGVSEQTMIWQTDGVYLRCRPDRMNQQERLIVDYKTTSASAAPTTFTRTILANGYDIQAAINLRGMRDLLGIDEARFVFLVQEIEPPYACSLVSLEPAFLAFADRKLEAAIKAWQTCTSTGKWPGFSSRICRAELPVYAEMQFAERQGLFL